MKTIMILLILMIYQVFTFGIDNNHLKIIKDYIKEHDYSGYAILNNKDESLLVTESYYIGNQRMIKMYWLKSNSEINELPNSIPFDLSYDENYYSFVSNRNLLIFNPENKLVNKLEHYDSFFDYNWSYDNQHIFYEDAKGYINQFNVVTGQNTKLLESNEYYLPVSVKDTNILDLMHNYHILQQIFTNISLLKYLSVHSI